jgi:glycosyltransferase involved in cell wall biosynthesis
LIFIVAYNHEKTIEKVVNRIPKKLFNLYDLEILIIDDASKDRTFVISKKIKEKYKKNNSFKINIFYNPINQGYGGNQKIGYHYAIKNKFRYVVLLHGDGQYSPEVLPKLLNQISLKKIDVVMGSRMINKKLALKGGMPLYKFVGNIILTKIQNFLLGTRFAEFHTGYRIYSINSLKKIPFHFNTKDFHFDTEILIQLVMTENKIKEISIPTFYGDEICHVNGIKYAFNVLRMTFLAKFQKIMNFNFSKKFIAKSYPKKFSDLEIDKLLSRAMKRK